MKIPHLSSMMDRRTLFSRVYFERNHDIANAVLVAGTGRSGTTWIARILDEYLGYRIMFEPFHPNRTEWFKDFHYKQYIPPEHQNEKYEAVFEKILTGRVGNRWTDKANRRFLPNGRIVKTIRASFFLKWLKNKFPTVPIIFILRHPCGVVYSRQKMKWTSMLDIILDQERLIQDHLEPYLEIIAGAETTLERNACLWCIENLVPRDTMESGDWLMVSYEETCVHPEETINRMMSHIGHEKVDNAADAGNMISVTTREDSAVRTGGNPVNEWREKFTDHQIERILQIVSQFGLDDLYDYEVMPKF